VPSRARREIFITQQQQQQQQLLLLSAYTMYTRAYKCAFVCVCVFPCAKQRSTESTCVLELFAREKRCDNGRLLFRVLARFSLRLEFALKFFAHVFLFRVYFVFVLLSFSISLSFHERMKKKSSNVTFWIDVAFVNGCE
jgi:hypothetical protein